MSETSSGSAKGGCGLGSIIAVCLSVKTWGWTWWALLHFFCGWCYVAYWVIFYSGWVK